jgi:hypothetical protein
MRDKTKTEGLTGPRGGLKPLPHNKGDEII